MRIISADRIQKVIAKLCLEANFVLRKDVLRALRNAYLKESNKRAKELLAAIIENARIARREKLAICQDTGLVCVFVELGHNVRVIGDLRQAINKGVEAGYRNGSLRNSVIKDPLLRQNPGYQPAIIHIDSTRGSNLRLTVLPKGFGCENKTQLRMFNPTVELNAVKKFILETVKSSGPDACPPYVVGVGIGGSADYACLLAKKALLRKLNRGTRYAVHRTRISKLESDLLKEINSLNIGPMGLGGKTTALAVNIEIHPTHIAGLPVCVNISCHALRSATKTV